MRPPGVKPDAAERAKACPGWVAADALSAAIHVPVTSAMAASPVHQRRIIGLPPSCLPMKTFPSCWDLRDGAVEPCKRRKWSPRAGGTRRALLAEVCEKEGQRDHAVANRPGVLVRATRARCALPGPQADRGHVPRDRADPGNPYPVGEVAAVERAEHVRDPGAELLVHGGQQLVVAAHEPLRQPCELLAERPVAPLGEGGHVVV